MEVSVGVGGVGRGRRGGGAVVEVVVVAVVSGGHRFHHHDNIWRHLERHEFHDRHEPTPVKPFNAKL